MYKIVFGILLIFVTGLSYAQRGREIINGALSGRSGNIGGTSADTSGKKDNLGFQHRVDDSVTLGYKFLDSINVKRLDSTISDFYTYFTEPATQQYLGNNGAAGYSIIFKPYIKPGWDAGFHAYDTYRFTLENTRFFKTTKPFSQISYQLATGKEQVVRVLHTQNPRPNINFGFEYKLISAPGIFVTQNTNHNSLRLFGNYQGKRKRYAAFFTLFNNTIKGSENGGVKNDSFLVNSQFSKRFTVPTNLGRDSGNLPNPFKSSVSTGNTYKDFTFFLRQSYDIGKKDSIIINDSTTDYLFYSKLRFQHTFTFNSFSYQFRDLQTDSAIYKDWYNLTLIKPFDTILIKDKWKIITNDFSLLQFPDTKNTGQYFLAGARLENISGVFSRTSKSFYNLILHGEYRNKTRNKKWDLDANGEFYLNGFNSGDYKIHGSLVRYFGKRWGNVAFSFDNVNRSPSYIYNANSSFNFGNLANYNKENITVIKASAQNSFLHLELINNLITNYVYFTGYYKTAQYNKVINIIQLSASKKIKLYKRWNWYADITLQQTDGVAPVKVPFFYTRNRIAYEGVFYKNLNLSMGIDCRYYSPYNAYDYSPVMGQFVTQDSVSISNRPDISAFLHFRIKSFTAFLRGENLNAINFSDGFAFTNNNFAAPHYAYPGFIFRFGIKWGFIN